MKKGRIWVISELYYPEETSTGYFLTRIAEGLTDKFEVHAICSRPTYSERNIQVPWRETRGGVQIHRTRSTRLDKDWIFGRVLNLMTFTLAAFFACLLHLRRGDQLLVVTNPPTIAPVAGVIARLKGARAVLLVHDVYPEVLVATGVLRAGSWSARLLGRLTSATYSLYDRVVVLGRDMAAVARSRLPGKEERVTVITNWGDLDEVKPCDPNENPFSQKYNPSKRTLIQFSGNIGRTHDVESILMIARNLAARTDIQFHFVGAGGKAKLLSNGRDQLPNVVHLPRQPRQMLGPMLASADAVVISFVDRMLGVSVPSRMYNVMAAGTPIIAMAHPESELAQVVSEEECGWVISPGDAVELTKLAQQLASPEGRIEAKRRGLRGREAVVRRFSLQMVLARYGELFSENEHSRQ